MCGMKVVVVASDESGNIDLQDLKAKALKHKDNLVGTGTKHSQRIAPHIISSVRRRTNIQFFLKVSLLIFAKKET